MGTDSTVIQHEGDIWSKEKEKKTPVTTSLVISTQQKNTSPQREREEKNNKTNLEGKGQDVPDRACLFFSILRQLGGTQEGLRQPGHRARLWPRGFPMTNLKAKGKNPGVECFARFLQIELLGISERTMGTAVPSSNLSWTRVSPRGNRAPLRDALTSARSLCMNPTHPERGWDVCTPGMLFAPPGCHLEATNPTLQHHGTAWCHHAGWKAVAGETLQESSDPTKNLGQGGEEIPKTPSP